MTKPTYYSYYFTTINYIEMIINKLINCLCSKMFDFKVTTPTTVIKYFVVR